jgi:hypothetical protein
MPDEELPRDEFSIEDVIQMITDGWSNLGEGCFRKQIPLTS